MSSFPKWPHVESGTNVVVPNALETVVENNAERVFDFIVAEDVSPVRADTCDACGSEMQLVGYAAVGRTT
jgi:hypothetical protein